MITLQNADKALKDYYLQAVTTQLESQISPFYSAIEKSSNYVYGKDVKVSIIRQNNESIMACAEEADLPTPYKNRYLDITVPLKNIYGTIEISDKAMRASRDSSGAFVNLVNAEMEGLISSAKYNFQRMLFGNGNGALCTIIQAESNTATSSRIIVDSAKLLTVGMKVDVVGTNGSKDEGVIIKSVSSNKYVSFNKALTVTPEKAIITYPGAYNNELTGLGAIFAANGYLYGYNSINEPYFAPYILSGSLDEDTLISLLDKMEEERNNKTNMILCSYKTRRKIATLLTGVRIAMNGCVDANGGYGDLVINGVPVVADKFCPENVVYFLNTDDFVLNQLCDWEWLEDEDGKILKQVPGKASYTATLVKYAELICKKPCGQAVLLFS